MEIIISEDLDIIENRMYNSMSNTINIARNIVLTDLSNKKESKLFVK